METTDWAQNMSQSFFHKSQFHNHRDCLASGLIFVLPVIDHSCTKVILQYLWITPPTAVVGSDTKTFSTRWTCTKLNWKLRFPLSLTLTLVGHCAARDPPAGWVDLEIISLSIDYTFVTLDANFTANSKSPKSLSKTAKQFFLNSLWLLLIVIDYYYYALY